MVTGLALVLHQSVGSGVVQQCVAQKLQVMMQLLARAKGGGAVGAGGVKKGNARGRGCWHSKRVALHHSDSTSSVHKASMQRQGMQ